MAMTILLFGLAGIVACVAIVGWSVRRLGLPVLDALEWFGLAELDAERR